MRKGADDATRHIVVGYDTMARAFPLRRFPGPRPPRLCVADNAQAGFHVSKCVCTLWQ
jgi:hypothetical protein